MQLDDQTSGRHVSGVGLHTLTAGIITAAADTVTVAAAAYLQAPN